MRSESTEEIAQVKLRNVLLFRRKIHQFMNSLFEGKIDQVMKELELANQILEQKFLTLPTRNTLHPAGVCKLDDEFFTFFVAVAKTACTGFPFDDESFALLSQAGPVERLLNDLIRLVILTDNSCTQFAKSLHSNCDIFYGQLCELAQVERHFYLKQFVQYLKEDLGSVSCMLCNQSLVFHNQIQGMLAPSVPVIWYKETRLVFIHQLCRHQINTSTKMFDCEMVS